MGDMNATQWARLSCRVLAVYSLIVGLETLQMAGASPGYVILGVLSSVLLFAVAAALWFGATAIALRMVPASGGTSGSSLTAQEVRMLVFASLGLLVLADSIPDLVKAVVAAAEPYRRGGSWTYGWHGMLARSLVRTIIGLWLIIGARKHLRAILPDADR
jgi:hypothetical protein